MKFEVGVIAGSKWKKSDILTNCAQLVLGVGQTDSLSDDNRSCASVKLDPFNVKVSKTGDQACQAGGECRFTIKLFNPGPIDHDAPVTISDNLNIGSAPITSISPPLPCAQQPTQIPFSCTSPGNVKLPLDGDPMVFTMTVRLPAGTAAEQFTNCVTVAPTDAVAGATQPRSAGGTADADGGSSSRSCHTVTKTNPTVATPQPQPPATPPSATPVADKACFSNMVLDARGGCACPSGTTWNGRQCLLPSGGGGTTAPRCPAGTTGTPPNCNPGSGGINMIPAPAPAPSPSPIVLTCPRGTTGTPPNCRPIGSGNPYPSRPILECPSGTVGTYPNCRPVPRPQTQVPPPPSCPLGFTGIYPNCTPTGSGGASPVQQQSERTCPDGTRPFTHRGRVVRCIPTQQQACPPNTTGTFPNCTPIGSGGASPVQQQSGRTCPDGTRPVTRGGRLIRCVPTQQQACPPNTTGTFPNCTPTGSGGASPVQQQSGRTCPDGTRPIMRGSRLIRCVPTQQQSPTGSGGIGTSKQETRECPAGTHGRYPRCRPDNPSPSPARPPESKPQQSRSCPPGTIGFYPRCRSVKSTAPTPVGPAPKPTGPKVCPSGLTGPNCDKIIVR